jgi:hypothetical protein
VSEARGAASAILVLALSGWIIVVGLLALDGNRVTPAPTPTVTVTERSVVTHIRPARPVTPTPAPRPSVASRMAPRSPGWGAGNWSRFPASIERAARCVAKHESWDAGLWTATNPYERISTASGFAQWIDSTWRAHARRAGVGAEYRRAKDAPPEVQAAVFAHNWVNGGRGAWRGTGCW